MKIYLVQEHSYYNDETIPLKAFHNESNAEQYKQMLTRKIAKHLQRGIIYKITTIDLI